LYLRVPVLILGSASARRARLLASLGVPFDIRPSGAPEEVRAGEAAQEYAARVAREKALLTAVANPGCWVLGADTVVVVDGEILGKPADAGEARRMLTRLSAREHLVVTAVALVDPGGALREEIGEESVVRFRRLSADEISCYVDSGEPFDKAGAYAIQGGAADFVARLSGSYENVVGLPVDAVREMLRRAGLYPPRVGP
jgi:septum formation protein